MMKTLFSILVIVAGCAVVYGQGRSGGTRIYTESSNNNKFGRRFLDGGVINSIGFDGGFNNGWGGYGKGYEQYYGGGYGNGYGQMYGQGYGQGYGMGMDKHWMMKKHYMQKQMF